MLITELPAELEDAERLINRRKAAEKRKDLWRSTYTDAYRYAMPARESFSWQVPGQNRNRQLYDSTLQEATYTAANTTVALLFPSWTRWANLSPGSQIPKEHPDFETITEGLQKATETFFEFLNHSNFSTVINEVALDLMIGTAGLTFEEGDNSKPFKFTSIPLSAIEIEEGPDGAVETDFMLRKICARNLIRTYPGMELFDLSAELNEKIKTKPDEEIEIVQGEIYCPENKHYYGVAIDVAGKSIIWRYDYGLSCPSIIARATKSAGETYGRGRVLLALSDARTLDKMQEFILRQAAIQLAPPMTGVSDGVLNPYTAVLAPNTILPVASNDNGNPSLRVLEVGGGNFNISQELVNSLRERVRRTMIGPEPSEGAVKSASEIHVTDRNRLWAMNGEMSRIQAELLAKIVARGVFILQRKGLIPRFRIDGREVIVQYNSPFTKSQSSEDVLALENTLQIASLAGAEIMNAGLKTEDMPAYIARKNGVAEALIRSASERKALMDKIQQVAQSQLQQPQGQPPQQGAPA